jgi:hypothetical protein
MSSPCAGHAPRKMEEFEEMNEKRLEMNKPLLTGVKVAL